MARVGLLGAGGMGRVHAHIWKSIPEVELLFHDPAGETTLEGVPDPGSLEALLDLCEAIDICLPTDLHFPAAQAVLKAGKNVFLEKPAARTAEEVRQLMDLAGNSVVAVGLVVRSFPEYARANQAIKSGTIGRVGAVRMTRGGAAPTGVYRWFRDRQRSGGILLDLAIHDFDWLRWTFGEPKEVFSRLAVREEGEYALTTLSFASGVVAHVESTWMEPSGFRTAFEACGSEGMLEFDSRNSSSLRRASEHGDSYEQNYAQVDDPYRKQLKAFLSGTPLAGLQDALDAQLLCEVAIESAESGRVVRF